MTSLLPTAPRSTPRPPRVAIIHPRLDGHGGLEKYGVHIIETLSARMPLDVVSEHKVDLDKVERAFGVRLDRPRFLCDPRCEPVVRTGHPLRERASRWQGERGYYELTRRYDLIIAQTVGLPYRSGARRSIVLCHFPVVRGLRIKSGVPSKGWRSLTNSDGREQRKIRARLDSWDRIIANSQFTRRWVEHYWHRTPVIINPPIDLPPAASPEKKRWIVGAGFFGMPDSAGGEKWSYKRQEVLIDAFRRLCDSGVHGWELHLAGHVLPPRPEVFAYVEALKARADNYPIYFHPNCARETLLELYRSGAIFWHATGFGTDPDHAPERMEHFGMVTAEAMGWGCVPIVINSGGQPEIVEHDASGLLWSTLDELHARTREVIAEPSLLERLGRGARARSERFGMERFRLQLNSLVDEELAAIGCSAE